MGDPMENGQAEERGFTLEVLPPVGLGKEPPVLSGEGAEVSLVRESRSNATPKTSREKLEREATFPRWAGEESSEIEVVEPGRFEGVLSEIELDGGCTKISANEFDDLWVEVSHVPEEDAYYGADREDFFSVSAREEPTQPRFSAVGRRRPEERSTERIRRRRSEEAIGLARVNRRLAGWLRSAAGWLED